MPSYRELLASARAEIDEISTREAHTLLDGDDRPLFVDVRPRDEWDEGHLPGAMHLPRNNLESRVEALIPDKARTLVVYCGSGTRSVFATKTLQELGYENAVNLAGGFTDWKRNGYEFTTPVALTPAQRARYARHLLIPEVGEEGQQRLLESRVLLIGAGGLGSPASLYLAAAGVGTIGIIDPDVVDDSNLQRQIVHSTERLGEPKVDSAKRTIEALNPDVTVVPFQERLDSENVERILAHGWDVIVDGTDNFPTRYLVNDASVWHGIPVVHGSIYRFEGQVTVFHPGNGPCYRCLYPSPPPPELAPSCAEGGVLGVLPGIVGSLQGSEALKLLLGAGESLAGRLLLFDALHTTFDEVAIRRNPECPVCGDHPTITEYIDYVEFCSSPSRPAGAHAGQSPAPLRPAVAATTREAEEGHVHA
jgi:molybdopterin/thiamine biosynthesis adenylyltransferase/rhodanese-related sulfurtransferase